jgi:pyridoxamine 5'-phosphate oxidase
VSTDDADPRARPLRRSELDEDPLRQFHAWLGEAERAGADFPEAMTLATATPDGRPSARMVLLKDADDRGFVFYTGYASRKARELGGNPRGALLFYWHPLGRQVRVEGTVEPVTREESEAYFRTRPPAARLAAIASRQSEPIASREALEARQAEAARLGAEPPLPDHWGGYRLVPDEYEFWQHRENRLHDRFRYRREGDAWMVERLQP